MVTVWGYEARKKSMTIKHRLYAHTDAVTCLAASPAYNVIVSGSRDSTAIIWDLSRGVFVRQLRGKQLGLDLVILLVYSKLALIVYNLSRSCWSSSGSGR